MTTTKHKIINILLLALTVWLASQLAVTCQDNKRLSNNATASASQVKEYRLKNGQLVKSVSALQLTNSELKGQILSKNEKLKEIARKFSNVKTVVKEVTKLQIDTIAITYKDTVPCVFERNGAIFHQWYSLGYNSNQKGITITDLSIPDSIMYVVGDKRKWLFGKKETKIDLTHANPFVQTESMQTIVIVDRKKWWQIDLFKFVAGVGFGYFVLK